MSQTVSFIRRYVQTNRYFSQSAGSLCCNNESNQYLCSLLRARSFMYSFEESRSIKTFTKFQSIIFRKAINQSRLKINAIKHSLSRETRFKINYSKNKFKQFPLGNQSKIYFVRKIFPNFKKKKKQRKERSMHAENFIFSSEIRRNSQMKSLIKGCGREKKGVERAWLLLQRVVHFSKARKDRESTDWQKEQAF